MLTAEENQLLTQVGPGTPCGELMRRYWQPLAAPTDLPPEQATAFVRILGEDLVLFRDRSGRVGLLADHCPHRGASLLYGRVEERGIACAYHGWLYDVNGNCLETPAEPADSLLHRTVKHRAYPVQEHHGLFWAYLGPPPAPELTRYDLTEHFPITSIQMVPQRDCNWLQVVENNMDQAHIYILHQSLDQLYQGTHQQAVAVSTTRGFIDDLESLDYSEVPFGINRRQTLKTGYVETDLMIFPGTQRLFNILYFKVPIDDLHTREFTLVADLTPGDSKDGDGQVRWNATKTRIGEVGRIQYYLESTQEAKSPADAVHPRARYRMERLRWQDNTVLETQGTIAAREHEHLGTSDRGVVLFRTLLKREIDRVQQGQDPIGVIRDPAHAPIDTYLDTYIKTLQRTR